MSWLDIEVRGDENRAPHLYLHGEGEKLAKKLGLSNWSVSLSHTESQAIAFVVAMGIHPERSRRMFHFAVRLRTVSNFLG